MSKTTVARSAFIALGLLCAVVLGCSDGSPSPAGKGAAPPADVEYLLKLGSADAYAAVAGEGAEVKYLARVEGLATPEPFSHAECIFQNTRKYAYHLFFLHTFPEFVDLEPASYEDLILRRSSRAFWAGSLKLFAATPHPNTGRAGILSYVVYTLGMPGEQPTVEELVALDSRLKRCIPYAAELLALVPDGAAQQNHLQSIAEELAAAGVAWVEPSSLRPGLTAEAYSEGEAYGYLRIVPRGQAVTASAPRDIVITEAAPGELTLVAGLVSALPQSLASHLNLRLREKGIPSASVPAIYDNQLVAALADQLVRLEVTEQNVTLEPARLADAEAFWQSRRPQVGEPALDLTVKEQRRLSAIGARDAAAFGAKSANLGELAGVIPAGNQVEGFAIPLRAYADFIDARGLDSQIEALLADPLVRTDASYKRARLAELRSAIRAAELLPEFVQALDAAIQASYGEAGLTTRLRFRSSTNAEDLSGLSGAGLYDSRSGCRADDLDEETSGPSACLTKEHTTYLRAELERRQEELAEHPERSFLRDIIDDLEADLNDEKSAVDAVRRVWASLWNERAFDDREYYGLDHRQVFMGIAVHPTFVGEQLEAVAITNLEPSSNQPLYRLVTQMGEVGVVDSSDPTATPEITTFRRSAENTPSEVTLVAPSSLSPDGARLWPEPALSELAGLLFSIQDHFAESVYPELDPLALDLEIDVTMDGRTVVKQARPYVTFGL